jgi:hypothetical protein
MLTLIKQGYKRDYDVIVEIDKNGKITEVIYHIKNKDAVVKVLQFKVNNYELTRYDKNGYNVVRSDKKKCQEYTGW